MPAFEPYKKHKRGRNTFIYLFLTKTWIPNLIGLGFIYLAYAMYYGPLLAWSTNFFANHADWYITVPMFASWCLILGLMVLVLSVMIGWRFYVHYKFIFDDHAFHLHRGFFFIRETTIPYSQVSNVHIARPYTYRMMGLAQLDIVTAADKSLTHGDSKEEGKPKQFLIPLIDAKKARALSSQLIAFSVKIRKGKEAFDSAIDMDLDDEDEFENETDSDNERENDSDEIESVEGFDNDKNDDGDTIEAETIAIKRMPQEEIDEIGDIDDNSQLELIPDQDSLSKKIR